jgi:hypothetical protein
LQPRQVSDPCCLSTPSMFRSDALCVQYKGFSPGCVARTVWSAGGGLSTASAASDSDAEAGRCACPHVLQKRSPTSVLLPQFPQNISRCLARLVRSGELGMIHHEVRVLHGQHCSFVGTAAGPTDFARSFGGTGAVRSATGADISTRDFGHRQRLSTSGGLGYDGGLAEGGSSSSYRTGFPSLSRLMRVGPGGDIVPSARTGAAL